ncbi:MAG: hypothetical protein OEY85_00040 [Rhodospirillales bacterium]|nr:hypothetical protein [Rhodospirillales bacterium]
MRSIPAHSAVLIFGLIFGSVFVVTGAHADGDPLPADSVIPELQESQGGIKDSDGRVQVYAVMADTDPQLREELEFMAEHGNAEAQATLKLMNQVKQAKSALRKVRKNPEEKENILKYAPEFTRQAVLDGGGYWEDPFFKAFLDKEKARRKKAQEKEAARQKEKEDKNSVGSADMNDISEQDLKAFAVGTDPNPDTSGLDGSATGALGDINSAAGVGAATGAAGAGDTRMFEAMRDNVITAPTFEHQPEGHSAPAPKEPTGMILSIPSGGY